MLCLDQANSTAHLSCHKVFLYTKEKLQGNGKFTLAGKQMISYYLFKHYLKSQKHVGKIHLETKIPSSYWLTDIIIKGSSDDPLPDELNPGQEGGNME